MSELGRDQDVIAEETIEEQIARLKKEHDEKFRQQCQATAAVVDEAEALARAARGSRPAMKAVRPPTKHDSQPAEPSPDLTSRFAALRVAK